MQVCDGEKSATPRDKVNKHEYYSTDMCITTNKATMLANKMRFVCTNRWTKKMRRKKIIWI